MKRKLLIGCGGALGLVLLAGAGVLLYWRSWLVAAPQPLDGRRLAGDETRLVLLYRAEQSDARAVELVRFLARELEAQGKVDEGLRSLIQWLGYRDLTEWASDLLPLSCGLLVERDQRSVWFVSFSRFANPICSAALRAMKRHGKPERGPSIYRIGDEYRAVSGNTLLVSRDAGLLASAVERLAGQPSRIPLVERLPGKAPLQAALADDGQFLARLLAQQKDEQGRSLQDNLRSRLDLGAEQFDWATLGGTVGLDKLEGRIELGCSARADPARIRESVERLLLEFVRHFLREELKLTHQARDTGRSVEVPFELAGLQGYWRKQVR